MFLKQAITSLFVIQRASQVLMIVLAVTMLVLPFFTQPQEASAEASAEGLLTCIVTGCFAIIATIIGVCLSCYLNACNECGDWGVGAGHLVSCGGGHNYYYCIPNSGWQHETCN